MLLLPSVLSYAVLTLSRSLLPGRPLPASLPFSSLPSSPVGGKRLLKEYITDDAMTLELCAAKCLELNRGYDLAGVE